MSQGQVSDISSVESEIDRLVYQRYGLTEDDALFRIRHSSF